MKCWIQIDTQTMDGIFPVDTIDEIREAQAALLAAGLGSAPVYAGDPDSPDAYANGEQILAIGENATRIPA